MKKKKLQHAAKLIVLAGKVDAVDTLIANKMMLVKPKDYHAAMLAELWNIYDDAKKIDLCQNLMLYCKTKNALDNIDTAGDHVLLISIKDSSDHVAPFAYFRNGSIDLIK